VYDYLQMTRCL